MNKKFFLVASTLACVLLLSGCSSFDITGYQPDKLAAHSFKKEVKNQISVGNFTMPASSNKSHVGCRIAGSIYLPNKETYTQYLQKAFRAQLIAADRFSASSGKHIISGNITSVDFNSFSGKWSISGKMRVDRNAPVVIQTVTVFGTSYFSGSACKDVAQAFSVAVRNFVTKTLNNSTIIRQLNH